MELNKFESQITKQVAPYGITSQDLFQKAQNLTVESDEDLKLANELKKEINAHSKTVKEARLEWTRPLDDLKAMVINKEREVLTPLEEAKNDISSKILDYEEIREAARQKEKARVQEIVDGFEVKGWLMRDVKSVDAVGKRFKKEFEELSEEDQNNSDIKYAFSVGINALTARKNEIEEEIRAEAERKRQAEEQAKLDAQAAKQSEEQAKIDKQRAEIEAKERKIAEEKRKIEAEKKRIEDQKEADRLKKEADEKAAKEAKEVASRPKSNIITVTKFEVEVADKVDRRYCSPDDIKIRQAIKEGATLIEGVKIWTERKAR